MNDAALIYLEADDEVTSVVRRVRASTEPRVVVVAPGRSRATSSVVALRLLARFAEEENREIAVVGDALTRSLAAEAGLAAYLTVEDARQAAPADSAGVAPRRAGIHVVRGSNTAEVAPTAAAAPFVDPDAAWAETRPRPVARAVPGPGQATGRRPGRRRVPVAVAAALLGALVAAAFIAGAVLLPAANVTIAVRTDPISSRTYTLDAPEAERVTGTVDDVATVSASGTYPILKQATGTVTLFNFNVSPVDVDAGTLVAAGQEAGAQAFATVIPVIVPEGSLTPEGFIQAGEATVNVMAAAPGPAGNVPAEAIDTVLSDGPRNRLRGFANNAQPLVVNPGPTSGGSESSGTEITQEDVDAAVASLREALTALVAAELDRTRATAVTIGEIPQPAIEGLDGLVGTRDLETVDIRGTLAYDHWLVDQEGLERAAAERFARDGEAIPRGSRVVDAETAVEVTEMAATADGVQVTVEVSGRAEAMVDADVVLERIRGRTLDDARAALRDFGRASIDLWPGWVTSVPDLEWRIAVTIERVGSASP